MDFLQSGKNESHPLLHIFLFGFHHKIGYQTEYCYPPLNSQNTLELPPQWKHLACIALPDGAHEFVQNSVYFTLPSVTEPNCTVFGVACHRQEVVERLKVQSTDVTRSSVMKSIAIIMSKPLFGCVRRRLETLMASFFDEGSLTDYKLLEDAFNQFSQSLTQSSCDNEEDSDATSLYHMDLSVRKLILHHKHNVLTLFKLLLLEKKVMYLESGSVLNISTQLLTLISLLPGMLHEDALKQCGIIDPTVSVAEISTSDGLIEASPMEQSSDKDSVQRKPSLLESSSSSNKSNTSNRLTSAWQILTTGAQATGSFIKDKVSSRPKEENATANISRKGSQNSISAAPSTQGDLDNLTNIPPDLPDVASMSQADWAFPLHLFEKNSLFLPYVSLYEKDIITDANVHCFHLGCNNATFKTSRKHVHAVIGADPTQYSMDADVRKQTELTSADLRFMDFLLSVIQSTKKEEINSSAAENSISNDNPPQPTEYGTTKPDAEQIDLSSQVHVNNSPRKSMNISTLINNSHKVTKLAHNTRFPSISSESELSAWEGSDDWIREHFRLYLQSLLISAAGEHSSVNDFNAAFVSALRRTRHYQQWLRENAILPLLSPCTERSESLSKSTNDLTDDNKAALTVERPMPWEHPFHKPWQVDDLRLRVNHLLSNTAQGKRINNMVHNTEKLVSGTSKAVYGAAVNTVLSARSMVSGFWASVQNSQQPNTPRP